MNDDNSGSKDGPTHVRPLWQIGLGRRREATMIENSIVMPACEPFAEALQRRAADRGQSVASVDAPAILIFKSHLFGYSETFIVEQARMLRAYRPIYTGLSQRDGLSAGGATSEILNHQTRMGRIRELGFAATGYAPAFIKRLRQHQPVLVHAHFGPSGALALPICRALRLPLVVTFHGYDATLADRHLLTSRGYPDKIYLLRRRQLLASAARFIAVSKFIAGRLIERGIPRERIEVHYTGIDTERFRPDPAVRRERIVLFVGRLVEKKGCEYLVRAMQHTAAQHPETKLVIVGDGPLRASLEGLAAQLAVRAHFVGVQPSAVVCQWMQRAMVMCVPSVISVSGDSEGLGMVFLESQACGTPVVATQHGPIPEVIAHGQTGFLAPERDARALSVHIGALLSDTQTWQQISRAARASVCAHFDLATQTRRLESIYAAAIEAGSRN